MNGKPPRIGDVDYRESVIASSSRVSDQAVVGSPGEWRDRITMYPVYVDDGVIIREMVRVHGGCDRPTVIGARTLLMSGSHVGHDTHVGTDCEVAPNAVIGGCCTVGNRVKIGMGATIRPHVTIGDNARIGMGSVVLRDVPAGETWVGNPAKKISKWNGVSGDETLSEIVRYQDGDA